MIPSVMAAKAHQRWRGFGQIEHARDYRKRKDIDGSVGGVGTRFERYANRRDRSGAGLAVVDISDPPRPH
jgi:hypothetical protein